MSTIHRFAATAVLILAATPALAAARPDLPGPATPVPACHGFADRLRAEGFSAPAANHFGRALRDDCLAA